MKKAHFMGLVCLIFILGGAVASVFWHFRTVGEIKAISAQVKPLRQNGNNYSFINPLLGYDVPGDVKEFNEYKPLEKQIQTVVIQENTSGLSNYAVYFRDLTLGRWLGVNQDSQYAPASMMKVVIMVSYFKQAETDPAVLQEKLQYSTSTADQISGVPLETPSNLEVGKSYTVEQLIETMIETSDNGAKNVLLLNIDQSYLNDVYSDLGLPNPADSSNYTISPKQYALILRILYNATYLSRQYSEQALKIMSQTQYKQGLIAGIPPGTAVAEKFGENIDLTNPNNPILSLSNCGIIYHQSHPYILCVMTKGGNLDNLAKTISLISKTVWDGVNNYALSNSY